MHSRNQRDHGFTLVELLVVIGIISLLAGLLLPVVAIVMEHGQSVRCKNTLRNLATGVRLYLTSYGEYFPLAWHKATATDLGGLTYHRFLVTAQYDSSFTQRITPRDLDIHGSEPAAARYKFAIAARFWQDAATGWTNDYFAPEIILKLPADLTETGYADHTQYPQLTRNISAGDRPLLTGANASVPHPNVDAAVSSGGPVNGGETRDGVPGRWESYADAEGINVFYGVAESLRDKADPETSRFDFRHSGAANFLFLDGHIQSVSATNKQLLNRIDARWNTLSFAAVP